MKIIRTAYRRTVEEYVLSIDEYLVKDINEDIRHWSKVHGVGFCDLTLKEVEDLINCCGDGYKNRDDEKLAFSNATLGDYVRDWINDALQDCEYTEVDGYTNDWEDEVIE